MEHEIRVQIVNAATDYFSRYGYEKTTVSDVANAIGFSKSYIYKFFESKQAIGEVICANRLSAIVVAARDVVAESHAATVKFSRFFTILVMASSELFFADRKLYDIAAVAAAESWPSVGSYEAQIRDILTQIVRQGRESGEFERETLLNETVNSMLLVMRPYFNPLMLQYNLDSAVDSTIQLSNLVLRSLAP
nr:TetR/AcrR family transcriptional regulator [Burkholderia sp. IMCC1007]